MNHAHLYLAGCGPYSEEHTTSALIELIAQADVILYDRLINPSLLEQANKQSIIEYVGKDVNERIHTQSSINNRILFHLQQGKSVLRLKSGDPFLFGRGFEEYEIAANNYFPVTVIPGLSSSLAVASFIGLPLTFRNLSQGITILTGTNKDNDVPHYTYKNKSHAYVFLMSVRHFKTIAHAMINDEFPPTTEAIAISNGTYQNQQIVCGTLSNISQKMKDYHQANPAIIIVSPTISLWKKQYRPRLLSTKIDGADFSVLDQSYHLSTTHIPLLHHVPRKLTIDDFFQLKQANTIILSSPITVEYAKDLTLDWSSKHLIAIGPKTKAIAEQFFPHIHYHPTITSLQSYVDTYQLDRTVILSSTYGKDIRLNSPYKEKIIPIFSLIENQTQLVAKSFDAITVYSPSSLEALVTTIIKSKQTAYFTLPLFCFGKNVYDAAQKSKFLYPILIETNQHEQFYQSIHIYFKERFSL